MDYLSKTKTELSKLAFEAGLLDIEEAQVDLLKRYLEVKAKLDYYNEYVKTIKGAVLLEIQKLPQEKIEMYGRTISTMESDVKYDFLNTNDPEFIVAHKKFSEWKKRLDDRKSFLKSMTGTHTVLDEETGEIVKVTRPIKTSTTVPSVK